MSETRYLTKAEYSAAKARLTRAINSGIPQRVIDVVRDTFATWDDGDYAYPDDWHRWQRASDDALWARKMEVLDDY